MKFVKIKHNAMGESDSSWALIIDSEEDLTRYLTNDAKLNFKVLLNTDFSYHVAGIRENIINTALWVEKHTAYETKINPPIVTVAKFQDKKAIGMFKIMKQYGALKINENGGYCPLDSYLQIWNGSIIDEIIKDDLGFPIENSTITKHKYLVLENNNGITYNVSQYFKSNNIQNYGVIKNLREKDQRYVFQLIQNAKNIIIDSEFIDYEQNKRFLSMFLKLKPKNIILFSYKNSVKNISTEPLFIENEKLHNITIISK